MTHLLFEYLPVILSFAGIVMVSVISPGPDFAVVVKNSLIYSRRTALLTAIGIACGLLVHISYSLLGIGLVISQSPWLLFGIKLLGGGYLLYIGIKALRAKKMTSSLENMDQKKDITPLSAFGSGFLTNALNPKCMLFIVSLFSLFVDPNTPFSIMLLYGAIMFVETLLWFGFVAYSLSHQRLREKFTGVSHWIERVTGGVLVSLGARLLYTV